MSIEPSFGQRRHLLGADHGDLRIAGMAQGQRGPHIGRGFGEHQLAAGRGDKIGRGRFAATIVEHVRGG